MTTVNRAIEKECTRCHRVKPLGAFSQHPQTRDGRQSWCKECRADHNAERSAETNYAYQRAFNKARHRAAQSLIDRYRDEFDRLMDSEMRAEGLR